MVVRVICLLTLTLAAGCGPSYDEALQTYMAEKQLFAEVEAAAFEASRELESTRKTVAGMHAADERWKNGLEAKYGTVEGGDRFLARLEESLVEQEVKAAELEKMWIEHGKRLARARLVLDDLAGR